MTNNDLTRAEAADYLLENYGKPVAVSAQSLARMACRGGGPEFYKIGFWVRYSRKSLDAWARAKLMGGGADRDAEAA